MAENLGAIRYDVEVGTAGMLKAESVVGKSTTNVANSFNKADASVKALNTQVSHTAKAVRRARPDMQNMSYQLQDMAVQAQMGTSAFVIMAQQLPQMLVGMGAWAGAIGVAITVLGLMATTLIDTTTDLEKMEKAVEQVKAVITIGAGGVANYSDELKKLSTISKEIAQIKLNTALAQQQIAIRNVGNAAEEAYKKAIPWFNWSFDNSASGTLFGALVSSDDLKRLGSGSKEITRARTGIDQLISSMDKIKAGKTAEGVEQLTSSVQLLSGSAVQNTKRGSELISTMAKIIEEYEIGKITIEQLTEAVKDSSKAFDDNSSKDSAKALQEYLKAIELSTIAINGNERELEKRRLELSGMSEQEQITALAAWDYMKKIEAQTEAQKEAVKADNERKKSLEDVNDELDSFFDKESSDSTKKEDQRKATLTTQVQSIGLTPEAEIQARFDKELELLKQAEEQKIEIEGTYAERRVQLEKEKQDAIKGLQSNTNQFMENAFGNLDTQIAGTLGNIVLGAQDGEEALKGLARTILTQVVGAIIQQGIASAFASKTAGTAQTTANTEALATALPLAAATSLSSFGANSLPAMAGIAAVSAATAALPSLLGGRQYGGPVSQGMYRVNETGTPEIYSQGGKDYLMNTKNANITPLDKAGGGSSSQEFNVNFNMEDMSDDKFKQMAIRNADLFVGIIRADKNNRGEQY